MVGVVSNVFKAALSEGSIYIKGQSSSIHDQFQPETKYLSKQTEPVLNEDIWRFSWRLLSPVQKLSKVTLILGFDPELSVLQYPLPLSSSLQSHLSLSLSCSLVYSTASDTVPSFSLYQTRAVESSANILHRNIEDPSLSCVCRTMIEGQTQRLTREKSLCNHYFCLNMLKTQYVFLENKNKWIRLFSKDALNWSDVTVKHL